MLLVVLVLLILVARADASPHDDAMALAARYADILTGVDHQTAPRDDDEADDDDEDAAAGAADADDAAGDAAEDDAEGAEDTDGGSPSATNRAGDADTRASTDAPSEREAMLDLPDDDLATALDDAETFDDIADDDHPVLGEVASLDLANVYPEPAELAEQSAAFQSAGGPELYDAWARHQRPSRFGRVDLDVRWRSYTSDPRIAPRYHSDELWLIATWRR